MQVIVPELLYRDGAFHRGLAVEFDDETGCVTVVGPPRGRGGAPDVPGPALGLPGRALLPGFVNAHSHAFQRLLRGRIQSRAAAGIAADFWGWREAMHRAAHALAPDDLYAISRFCFLEMLRAGITHVGEFHYLHNDPAGQPYADPGELAKRVVEAAEAVGIRITLLLACYAAGGIGEPLSPMQRRFVIPSPDRYFTAASALRSWLALRPRTGFGVAPHSVRAVPRDWLGELAGFASKSALPVHMHVSEQPAEVSDCLAAYGRRPVQLLADEGLLGERFTAVHATHLIPAEVHLLGEAGAGVCVCPTTEADLGDGFPPASELLHAGAVFSLGTDSQAIIDPLQEMRQLELHERLRTMKRVALAGPGASGRLEVAPVLLAAGTTGGSRALGLDGGRIEPGAPADFVAIDLDHLALAGWSPETLPALLALSATAAVVTDVWVGGIRRLRGRQHDVDDVARTAFETAAARIGVT